MIRLLAKPPTLFKMSQHAFISIVLAQQMDKDLIERNHTSNVATTYPISSRYTLEINTSPL